MNCIEFYRSLAFYDEQEYENNINEIEKQLESLEKEYLEKNESVKTKLTKKIKKYLFTNGGFHDFDLVDILINQNMNKRWQTKVGVTLTLTNNWDNNIYKLDYREVQKINIDSQTNYSHGIDQWDRAMFDVTENKTLKHQILFTSQTVITIEFKKLFLHVEKKNSKI